MHRKYLADILEAGFKADEYPVTPATKSQIKQAFKALALRWHPAGIPPALPMARCLLFKS